MTKLEIAQEIRKQIAAYGWQVAGSWGAQKWAIPSKFNGLEFKVNGRHFKGYVQVELDPSDTYTVRFVRVRKGLLETIKQVKGLYCDEFVNEIDQTVESGKPI